MTQNIHPVSREKHNEFEHQTKVPTYMLYSHVDPDFQLFRLFRYFQFTISW